jgi:hypothetical protein
MRRALIILASLSLLLAAMAQPVAAGGSFFHGRSSGYFLEFSWVQLDRDANGDRLPALGTRPFGNTHIGFAYAFSTSSGRAVVQGQIADLNCPTDFIPPFGGGHGGFSGAFDEPEPEPEPESPCTHIGVRQVFGDDIPLTIDRKLGFARLGGAGVLIGIYGSGDDPHGGPGELLVNVPINTTFTGVGTVSKSTGTSTGSDGTNSYTSRYTSLNRQATMGGVLGPMGYAEGLSGGAMSYFKESFRQRTR